MTVTVVYTTQLKTALDISSEELNLNPPVHIQDVIQALRQRHGAKFADLVLREDGSLQPSILLCLGDEQIGCDHPGELKPGDVATFLSAISGG